VVHALSVDVEDWYHDSAVQVAGPVEHRVEANTLRLLDIGKSGGVDHQFRPFGADKPLRRLPVSHIEIRQVHTPDPVLPVQNRYEVFAQHPRGAGDQNPHSLFPYIFS
jgi:hypothetical protein